jgi:hypothetical protein
MGVPRKIIAGMRAHNGTEPDLIEEEDRFTVRLWKEPKRKYLRRRGGGRPYSARNDHRGRSFP